MNHQLIDRLQNFTLDKKILSIDSNDRDISKWPSSSEFEISCPQNYNNVESIRLVNIQTQNKFYNISEYLQNNKLMVEFNGSDPSSVILDDGFYNEIQLQNSLNSQFQKIDPSFVVKFNEVNRKMYFGHPITSFKLKFTGIISYNNCGINNYNNIYKQHTKWGLGAILGFDKKIYESKSSNNRFQYETSDWITSNTNIIEAPKTIDLNENEQIY